MCHRVARADYIAVMTGTKRVVDVKWRKRRLTAAQALLEEETLRRERCLLLQAYLHVQWLRLERGRTAMSQATRSDTQKNWQAEATDVNHYAVQREIPRFVRWHAERYKHRRPSVLLSHSRVSSAHVHTVTLHMRISL